MESVIEIPHAAHCSRGYYGDGAHKSHKFLAEAAAVAEEEACGAVDEEDEEEEEEQDEEEEEEEEEEEGEDDFDEAMQEDQKRAPNKDIEAPASVLVAAPPALGQLEPQQPAQRGAKRSRPSTAKERISKMPPCAAGKRSSIYRGVTRHRWTGRYEAHLWDKSTWNQNQNKKGKQVYLGAYDDEEAAARAYDLAALKYWGPGTLINFPVSDYARDIDEMQSLSREEYLGSLRRKSSGFSRGGSKMKGVNNRHHPNARWDVQVGRSFASTLPQLGGYVTIGDGAVGRPTQEYGTLGCPTSMINLCHFMNWLQPPNLGGEAPSNNLLKKSFKPMEEEHLSEEHNPSPTYGQEFSDGTNNQEEKNGAKPWQCYEPYQLPSLGLCSGEIKAGIPALMALSQSSMFTEMEERLNGCKGQESAARRVCESAADALAAALAMDDCLSSPLGEKVEKTSCPIDNSYPISYVDVHPVLALPLPPLPFEMDHPAYLSDQVPCLWNPFEPPSNSSMGMTLQ